MQDHRGSAPVHAYILRPGVFASRKKQPTFGSRPPNRV